MTGARLYCFDCGQPYAADPMKRVRCHSGDMLSTEAPLPRDSWYPVRKFRFKGDPAVYYAYEAPTERIV